MARMTGGQALVKSLRNHGIDTIFGLPGVQLDGLFNALYDEGNAIRVIHTAEGAHMGHINAPMILGTLGGVEIGLSALAIPHGKGGVQAAIDWLGQSVPA